MYLSILALPLFGSAVAGLLGRKIGVTGAHIITTGSLMTTAALALVAFYEVGLCGSSVSIELFSWIDSEFMMVSWGFLFDSLTVSMLLPVLIVSSLVHLYSISYMAEDPHNQRFFSYLSMFTFFMLVLVTGDNYLIMFVGWEGIGISSYLLINFWYTRIQANKSGIKALTVNRVGDMFLSVGFFAIFWVFGNVDYATVFSVAPFINETAITIIGLLLLLGAMAKSANLGLHTWLPDAMEGKFTSLFVSIVLFLVYLFAFECSDNLLMSLPPLLLALPQKSQDIITGNMLGDGSVAYSTGRNGSQATNARYSMTMKADAKPYMLSLLDQVYGPYCGSGLIAYPNINLPQHVGKEVTQYYFATLSSELFSAIHSMWYRLDAASGRYIKIVPSMIIDMLSPLALAHWIMEDGYFEYGKAQTVLLCTESFTKAECELLILALAKLDIIATLKVRNKAKGSFRVRISKTSMHHVRNLVQPYMHPMFTYKLGL
jgi:hypothetical protein